MRQWSCDNRDIAEQKTLQWLINDLEWALIRGDDPKVGEILQKIRDRVKWEESTLDRRYRTRARSYTAKDEADERMCEPLFDPRSGCVRF